VNNDARCYCVLVNLYKCRCQFWCFFCCPALVVCRTWCGALVVGEINYWLICCYAKFSDYYLYVGFLVWLIVKWCTKTVVFKSAPYSYMMFQKTRPITLVAIL